MDSNQDIWLHSSKSPSLEGGEIHIWRTYLDQSKLSVQALFNILSSDEKQRADKYYFEKDREHFIVARGTLREILSDYLDVSPSQIRFSYNRYGKPALSYGINNNLFFNMSHSQGLALYAVTQKQKVGIDIEFINKNFAIQEVAESFFSPTEMSILKGLPSSLQPAAFFSYWTRKEALVKAIGKGLSYSLKELSVFTSPKEQAILLFTNDFKMVKLWSLMLIPSDFNYLAAVAVEGSIQTLRYLQL